MNDFFNDFSIPFQLCVKQRDFMGGSFEHDTILRMISERCERMIVVISPAFLSSPANTFFMSFAQAIGIEHRRRKIIPCLYEPCTLPPTLSYYHMLVYKRHGQYFNFWDKLRDSIQQTAPQITVSKPPPITTMPRCVRSTAFMC